MRIYFIFILLLILSSCENQSRKQESKVSRFIYSKYMWGYNDSLNQFQFNIVQYLDIDSSGISRVMKQDKKGKNQFFKTRINDSLLKQINTLFIKGKYKEAYPNNPDTQLIYDGFTYLIDYSSEVTGRHFIRFIPEYAPTEIQNLQSELDKIIAKKNGMIVSYFNLAPYVDSLKSYSLRWHKFPPKPVHPMIHLKSSR